MAKEPLLTVDRYRALEIARQLRKGNPMPEVGIWWDDGRVLAVISDPLDQGERAARWINGQWDHWRAWPAVAALYSRTTMDEYSSIPRGRVVYDVRNQSAVMYHGSDASKRRLAAIAREFNLTAWSTLLDLHYEKVIPDHEWDDEPDEY